MKLSFIILFFCLLSNKVFGSDYYVVFYISDKKTNQPIKNARVGIKETGWQFSETDPNGKVQFSNVPIGEIHYLVTKDGYLSYEGDFNVTTETKSNNVTVKLLNSGFGDKQKVFVGEVTDESGNDIADAIVELKISNKIFTAKSDASGNYDFTVDLDLFPPGISEYTIEVKKGGCTTREKKQLPANNQIINNIKFRCITEESCEARNSKGILFKLEKCYIQNYNLICLITITNDLDNGNTPEIEFNSRNAIILTDDGAQYKGNNMIIGDEENFGMTNDKYYTVNGTKVRGVIRFNIGKNKYKSLQVFQLRDQGLSCKNINIQN